MNKLVGPFFILLAFALGCRMMSNAKVGSEQADATPVQTVNSGEVKLNSEPSGSLDDLTPLSTKVAEIVKDKEDNGIFVEGTNEVPKSIFLAIDPNVSVGKVGELAVAISSAHGTPILPRTLPGGDAPIKPNPLVLVASVGDATIDTNIVSKIYSHSDPFSFSYRPAFEFATDTRDVLYKRVAVNSVEIAADDKLYVNQRVIEQVNCEPNNSDVKQQPVTVEQLKGMAPGMIQSYGTQYILASEKASYATLVSVLEAFSEVHPFMTVVVRRTDLPTPQRPAKDLRRCDLLP